jgi:hypothetical protein
MRVSNGPPPKDPSKRQRRNPDQIPHTEIAADAKLLHPPKPPKGEWTPAIRRYWDTWARSAMATQFTDTDWQRLEMLLPLVQKYMTAPDVRTFAEIVKSESLLGATVADRLRMRVKLRVGTIDRPEPTERPVRRRPDPRLRAVT